MSRKAIPTWPDTVNNLMILMSRERIVQEDIGKIINRTQQTVSLIIRGKRGLTEAEAKMIQKKYPAYRFEWLMGYENEPMTEEQRILQILDNKSHAHEIQEVAFDHYSELCGYSFDSLGNELSLKEGFTDITQRDFEELKESWYTMKDVNSEESVYLSMDEMNMLNDEIMNFAHFTLSRFFKNKQAEPAKQNELEGIPHETWNKVFKLMDEENERWKNGDSEIDGN